MRRGFSLVELVAVIALVLVLCLVGMPVLKRVQESQTRASCQSNLKTLGFTLRMYASEHKEVFPPIQGDQPFGAASNAVGCVIEPYQTRPAFSPRMDLIYPEYLKDLNLLICPARRNAERRNPLGVIQDAGGGECEYTGQITRGDHSYIYLGYIIDRADDPSLYVNEPATGPAQLVAVASVMSRVLLNADPSDDKVLDEDIILADIGMKGGFGNHASMALWGDERIVRTRYWMTRMMITDINNNDPYATGPRTGEVPLLWDKGGFDPSRDDTINHENGCNVLFLNGHVEFLSGNRFPVRPERALLNSLLGET